MYKCGEKLSLTLEIVLILAGDVNAKSLMWYSRDDNMRGHKLEAFNRGKSTRGFHTREGPNNME